MIVLAQLVVPAAAPAIVDAIAPTARAEVGPKAAGRGPASASCAG